jgi:hypothetical protein
MIFSRAPVAGSVNAGAIKTMAIMNSRKRYCIRAQGLMRTVILEGILKFAVPLAVVLASAFELRQYVRGLFDPYQAVGRGFLSVLVLSILIGIPFGYSFWRRALSGGE